MATAAELLKIISTQPDPEGHIVVGGDRFITVPENLKRLGVQYDHNIEKVTFDCPRKWDNNDMSQMAIYIVYARSNGSRGTFTERYPVSMPNAPTVTIDENDDSVMHFDWVISRNVTEVPGPISFMVCVMKTVGKTDEEGNETFVEEQHWNSEICNDCYISPGMEGDDYEPFDNVDVFTEFANSLAATLADKVSTSATAATNAQTAAETAAANAQNLSNDIINKYDRMRNYYASAIKNTISGHLPHADDVSPTEHDVKCLVRSKNLVSMSYVQGNSTTDKTIIQINGNTVTFPAHDGNLYGVMIDNAQLGLKVGHTYTASVGSVSAYDATSFGWRIGYIDGTETKIVSSTATFTVEKEIQRVMFRIGSPYTGNTESIIENIQIEEGSVATAFTSYVDPSTISVTGCGNNIIDCSNYTSQKSGFFSNVTLIDSNDTGTVITIKGANGASACANSSGWLVFNSKSKLNLRVGDKVTMSADITLIEEGIYGNVVKFAIMNDSAGKTSSSPNITLGSKQRFTVTRDVQVDGLHRLMLMVNSNTITVENIMVSINGKTEYEEYVGATFTPLSDGSCVVTSVSPSMNIFTTTPGVIVEAEYNADTKTYIDNIPSASDEQVESAVNKYIAENGNILIGVMSEIVLRDASTGKNYRVYVSDGKLHMGSEV